MLADNSRDAAIQAHPLVLEAELAPGARRRLGLTLIQQLHENRLVEFPGAVSIGISQGRFLRRCADAQMLQRRFASGQPQADFAQGVQMRHLAKQHGHELLPASEPLGGEFGLMLLDGLCELPAWDKLQKLRVDTAYWSHG
jgi:hypothetical protein